MHNFWISVFIAVVLQTSNLLAGLEANGVENEKCLSLPQRTIDALDSLRLKFAESDSETNSTNPSTGNHFSKESFRMLLKSVGLERGTITVRTTEHHWKMMVISKKTKSTTRFFEHAERSRRHNDHDQDNLGEILTDEVQVHIDPNVFTYTTNDQHLKVGKIHPFKHESHFDMDKHPNELCLNSSTLTAKYDVRENAISYNEFTLMCPEILNQIAQMACVHHTVDVEIFMETVEKPMPLGHRIVCALLVTTLIGALSIAVSFLLKTYIDRHQNVSEGKGYKRVITFFIALAIGTLTGDAFLHLIPEAMHSDNENEEHDQFEHSQLTKRMLVVVITVYVLYMFEKVIEICRARSNDRNKKLPKNKRPNLINADAKISMNSQESEMSLKGDFQPDTTTEHSSTTPMLKVEHEHPYQPIPLNGKFDLPQCHDPKLDDHNHNGINHGHNCGHSHDYTTVVNTDHSAENGDINIDHSGHGNSYGHDRDHGYGHAHCHGHSHSHSYGKTRSLMVIVGDGFHNFIDGLAIGSAFSSSLVDGLATSIAVGLHEIPHEVGDFVVLVNNGVKPNQVLKMALISNSIAIAGVGAGALIGSSASESAYVLCTAAGCFIYVGLINMLPHAFNMQDPDRIVQGIMHVLGIMSGLGIMTLIALHESAISHFVEHLF
ncbi:zinc transporter ZIP10-like isoform X2 [Convolutriloba macropyga]|uniref:zinc transporter ZIP10-like isoform X2 n=1 Tax=Convolutriloba macropyga TaxID=536237 RepID=UPI003F51AD1F